MLLTDIRKATYVPRRLSRICWQFERSSERHRRCSSLGRGIFGGPRGNFPACTVVTHTRTRARPFADEVLLQGPHPRFHELSLLVRAIVEPFEAFTLIQTGKIAHFPIVLLGAAYWRPLTDLLQRMVIDGAIGATDPEVLFLTDSVEDATVHLKTNAIDRFALRAPKPSRWLGERPSLEGAVLRLHSSSRA
jgi:hypothetical protein